MNILQAFHDPRVFATAFPGNTWGRWLAFLAALFALPMDDTALAYYRHHTGRQFPPAAPSREAVLKVGRRAAKSRMLSLIAVYLAVLLDHADKLAPGEVPTVLIIAADRKQARVIFRYVRGLIDLIDRVNQGEQEPLILKETGDALELSNGVAIEIATASYRTIRGYTLIAALCDEVALWRDDTGANPDDEILNALRPALVQLGGLLLVASSPWAKRGAFYTIFRDNFGRDEAEALVWSGSTLEMNPTFSRRAVEKAYENDPERASAEFGAEFRNDLATFVQREVVEACVVPGLIELPRVAAGRHVAFVDPSGGSADSMTLGIAHQEGPVAVLDALRERKPPFSPEDVVAEFCTTLKAYGITSVTGDRYAGEWPRERFRVHGVAYELSERTKGAIYQDSLPLLNSRRVRLLDSKVLVAQLCGLERRTARGGRESIDHGPAAHDDVANAAMGSLLLAAAPAALPKPARSLNFSIHAR